MDRRGLGKRMWGHLSPRKGGPYELWDLAVLAFSIVAASYLIAVPSTAQAVALSWLIGPTPQLVWGYALSGATLAAIICAYDPRTVAVGRGIIVATSFAWSGVLLLGYIADITLADDSGPALVPAAVLGVWAVVVAAGVMVRGGGRSWRRIVLRSLEAGVLVAAIVATIGALGDPRPLSVAVLFGYFCRSAIHQGEVYCVRGAR